MKRLLLWLGFALASLGLMAGSASAYANTPTIDPGYNSRIIDDTVFTNYGAMSVDDIQAFLNAKVPTCDSNHANPDGSAPSTPYICLKDYVDPTVGKRASQVIWDAAQEFSVNPRVILVTLQKEQSLVTDTWPYTSQYRSAMGYGCPESQSVCDSQYYGFYNQVHLGTKLLRVGYDRNCGNTSSYPGWTFGAQWAKGRTTSVDGRGTYLSNCATGAFYGYTPHRPDSAYTAVSGTYYYGNYNFVTTFNSWFGAVWAPVYSWQQISKIYGMGGPTIHVGETSSITVVARNTGSTTWTNTGTNPIRIGTSGPRDRNSAFYASNWLGVNRPATMNESSVGPGQDGTFTFSIKAPATPGAYNEQFNLVVDGITWLVDPGNTNFAFNVIPYTYSFSVTSQSYTVGPTTTAYSGSVPIDPGDQQTWHVVVQNTGDYTWHNNGANPVVLAAWLPSRDNKFRDAGWVNNTYAATVQEATVAPGGTGTFNFTVTAPAQTGVYAERYNLGAVGTAWFNDAGLRFNANVHGNYSYTIASQSYTVGSTTTPYASTITMNPADTQTWTVTVVNTGDVTWHNSGAYPVVIAGWQPSRTSRFKTGAWINNTYASYMQTASVAPGASGTFVIPVQAPAPGGTFAERFNLGASGVAWFPDAGLQFTAHVNANYSYAVTAQNFTVGSTTTPYAGNIPLNPGDIQTWNVSVTNTGDVTWHNDGQYPVVLSVWSPDRTSRFQHATWVNGTYVAYLHEATVAPGGTGSFSFTITAPPYSGPYTERFNLGSSGAAWFSDAGLTFNARVNGTYTWQLISQQYSYRNAAGATLSGTGNTFRINKLAPGTLTITAKNTGTATWYRDGAFPLRIFTTAPGYRSSDFSTSAWPKPYSAATLSEASVPPNSTGTFVIPIQAPYYSGNFSESFNAVADGSAWLNDLGINYAITVNWIVL